MDAPFIFIGTYRLREGKAEGFLDSQIFRPSSVKGNSSCGRPRDGFSCAPSAWMPTWAPAAGTQIPEISRRGAGAGFSPFRSKS